MSGRTRGRIAAVLATTVIVGALLATQPASAQAQEADEFDCSSDLGDPAPGTPEWDFAYFDTLWCRTERPAMTAANPAYDAAIDANRAAGSRAISELTGDLQFYDPFRDFDTRWEGQRGDLQEVTFTTRAGAVRKAMLLSPLHVDARKPLPGVLLVCDEVCDFPFGFNIFQWAAQALAEHGYVVMYAQVATHADGIPETVDATDFFVSTPDSPSPRGEVNPWHARIDRTRLGIAGQSSSGTIAMIVGHNDERYDAIVAWDPSTPALLAALPTPRIPTMVQIQDIEGNEPPPPDATPSPAKPVPEPGSRYTVFDSVRAAGVDAMQVVPRGSTHVDWAGVGCTEPRPVELYGGCTRYGEQVATYYTLAWFDRYLRGAAPPPGPTTPPGERGHRRAIANDALRRLTATHTFDDSSDVYSIGTGFFDEERAAQGGSIEAGNVPITIEGLSIRNRLSFWYPTRYFLDGGDLQCEDLRSGWPPPSKGGQGLCPPRHRGA